MRVLPQSMAGVGGDLKSELQDIDKYIVTRAQSDKCNNRCLVIGFPSDPTVMWGIQLSVDETPK
jgi:hypothetical protein